MKDEKLKTKNPAGALARICLASLLIVSIGCKRRQAARGVTASTQPSTLPAITAATTRAAPATQVTLAIDGSPVAFPLVRLRATATGAGVAVQLTTQGTDDQTTENSIYFDLTVPDADDPSNLPGTEWHFQSDDADRSDTLNGIFLYGHAAALEPRDVTISFGESSGVTMVEIEGQFRLFDPADSEHPQKTVPVHGRFSVAR